MYLVIFAYVSDAICKSLDHRDVQLESVIYLNNQI